MLTLAICRSCISCQNWVYVISLSLSTRHMVCGSDLTELSRGMLAGSWTLDFVTSTLGPFRSSTAAI